jgi:hypothetical protein
MENIQTQTHAASIKGVLQHHSAFIRGVLQHMVAGVIFAILSFLTGTYILPNYIYNKGDLIYWVMIVTAISLAGCALFSLVYRFRFHENTVKSFRFLTYSLIFLLAISISGVTFLYTRYQNILPSGPVVPTLVTGGNASVTLEMGELWKDISEMQRQSSQKLSEATLTIRYLMRKYDDLSVFSQRVGTTRTIVPEWESDPLHPIRVEETVTDDSKKCSDKIQTARMVYTDISGEKVGQPFDYWFKIKYFNGHNKHKDEWQAFFVEIPVDSLDFRIKFPKSMQFPKAIRLRTTKNCFESGDVQAKMPKAKSPDNYFEENSTEKEIVWHIKNPLVKHIYKIEWDWE